MNHGATLSERMRREAERYKFGATGEHPVEQVDETDEGAIEFGVAHEPATGRVFLNFGKPVAWLAMTAVQARDLGMILRKHAACLDGIEPGPLGDPEKGDEPTKTCAGPK